MLLPLRRFIIVEDQEHSKESLLALLTKHFPELEFAGWADTIAKASILLEKAKPDLVFMDVQLPDGTSFDLLQSGGPFPYELIFTTAFEEYAVRAFRLSAADYILKPIGLEELSDAIQKAKIKRKAGQRNEELETLIHNISQSNLQSHRISIPTTHGLSFISVSEIVRFESDNAYSTIFLNSGKNMVACRSIGDFESMLEPYSFFRIHKSHLINMNQIREYMRVDGGYIVMADGARVEISRRKKDDFLEQMGF